MLELVCIIPSLFEYSNHTILQGHECIIKSLPFSLIEGILHLCNQVVDVSRLHLVLQALYQIEEAKIKYIKIWTILRLWSSSANVPSSIAARSRSTVCVASIRMTPTVVFVNPDGFAAIHQGPVLFDCREDFL